VVLAVAVDTILELELAQPVLLDKVMQVVMVIQPLIPVAEVVELVQLVVTEIRPATTPVLVAQEEQEVHLIYQEALLLMQVAVEGVVIHKVPVYQALAAQEEVVTAARLIAVPEVPELLVPLTPVVAEVAQLQRFLQLLVVPVVPA
jgi:hypothetical protein